MLLRKDKKNKVVFFSSNIGDAFHSWMQNIMIKALTKTTHFCVFFFSIRRWQSKAISARAHNHANQPNELQKSSSDGLIELMECERGGAGVGDAHCNLAMHINATINCGTLSGLYGIFDFTSFLYWLVDVGWFLNCNWKYNKIQHNIRKCIYW